MKNKGAYLSELGYSIIPVRADKIPLGEWKRYQESHRTPLEVQALNSPLLGIVTGYNDLEVVDVDLKVFSTTTEKTDFWNELISFLKDSIYEFDDKFVIAKTKNQGFHLLYKTKRVSGNRKIAVLKGHSEAVIETRGNGGMVVMYDEFLNEKHYKDITYISDDDYFSLMRICESYNYIKPESDSPKIDAKTKKQFKTQGITPWEDFNNQNSIWDVVRNDFTIYRDTPKKTFIKRIGAKSSHSGYIFKEDNLMYLHSTGTIYPAEKQISPYHAFTIKYHSGDFSASAKDLYSQGFGDRLEQELKEKEEKFSDIYPEIEKKKIKEDDLIFPIEIFPKPFQNFILECNDKLDDVIDFSACSLIWAVSLLLGNRFHVKVKSGWYEVPVVWISLVGHAGVGKTPSIRRMLYPLIKENNSSIRKYIKKQTEFEVYDRLTQKEKEQQVEVKKPAKEQFIADDITLEALVDLHQEVPTGVGVFKDELAGWLKDMNKYREGSDLEFWLSTWSGSSVNVNRMSRAGSFVESPFIPVIGGIQPSILNELYTQDKKDNGFLDRMLITYPEVSVAEYNEQDISEEAISWYNTTITNLKRVLDKFTELDENGNVIKHDVIFDKESKQLWVEKFNEITNAQNSDYESEYFKSMYPKQKSYIPRFALILNVLNSLSDSNIEVNVISKKSMEGAIKLSDYFVATAKKIKFEKEELDALRNVSKKAETKKEKAYHIWKANKEFNRTKVAEMLDVSRQTIINYIKDFESKKS